MKRKRSRSPFWLVGLLTFGKIKKLNRQRLVFACLTLLFVAWGMISSPAFSQMTYTANAQLIEQGRKLYETGNLSAAVKILQQAADDLAAKGDKLGEALAYSNMSLVFKQIGDWEKASKAIATSLQILTSQSNSDIRLVLAQTLEIQGNLELELGKTQQALNTWKQAANIYAKLGDEVGITRSLINQSIAQQALGQYLQSRMTLEQMYPRLSKQPDSLLKATALRSLGDVVQLVGNLELSLKVLLKSRDIAEKLQSPPEISAALLSLGNIYEALGNRESQQYTASMEQSTPLRYTIKFVSLKDTLTLKFYQQAAQSYAEAATVSTSLMVQIPAQLNQLNILLKLQKWLEAEKLSADMQLKLSKIPPSQTGIYAQIQLAQSLVCLKQATKADTPSGKEIAQILATAIQQARSIDDKRSLAYGLGALGGLYLHEDMANALKLTQQGLIQAKSIVASDITYLWQWQLGQILKNIGDIPSAIASYTEAVNNLKFLRNDLIALNADVQFSFRDNVEPVYRQLVDLLLQPSRETRGQKHKQDKGEPPTSPFSVSQDNLKQARNVIEALQLSLENFFREACLQAKSKQIDEVVDKTDPTAAVIYPIILKDRL